MRNVCFILICLTVLCSFASRSADIEEDTEDKSTCVCEACTEKPLIKTQSDAERVGRALFTAWYGENVLAEVGGTLAVYVERKRRGAYWLVGGKRLTREGRNLVIAFDHQTGCFFGPRP